MQKTAAFLMVSVLVTGLLLMSESRREPAVGAVDDAFADWVSTNATRTPPPAHVALVEINDSSVAGEHAWPWSPLEYALFLQAAEHLKPEVIGIEPVLIWKEAVPVPPQKMAQYRNYLHDYILQAPKLVLGAQLGVPEDPDAAPALQPAPLLRNVKGDTRGIPQYTDIVRQAQEDYRLSAAAGFTNLQGADGVLHKAPLVFSYRGEIVPSFTMQALIQWFKLTPDDVTVEPGRRVALGKNVEIPIDNEGRMNVDFGIPFTRLGYDDLLLEVEQQQEKLKSATTAVDALNGSVVILARTDKDSRTLSFPTHTMGSSGELFARAIATAQSRSFARRVGYVFDFGVIAAMMALSCFFHCFSKRRFLLVSLLLLLGYLFAAMSLYAVSLLWLPLVLPVGLLVLVNFFSLFSARVTTTKDTKSTKAEAE